MTMVADDRRAEIVEAVDDARDCLTRAAALYAQYRDEADLLIPPRMGDKIGGPGKPESRPPSSGDNDARRMLRTTRRHLAACVDHLAHHLPPVAARPPVALAVDEDVAARVVARWVRYVDEKLTWAQHHAHHLDDDQAEAVLAAARSARAALRVWDTPPTTPAMRKAGQAKDRDGYRSALQWARSEHGTAVRPPAHYPAGERCNICRWRLPSAGRKDCDACRKAKQREHERLVRRARRRHRSEVRIRGVSGEHTSGDFDHCACHPRRKRGRTKKSSNGNGGRKSA